MEKRWKPLWITLGRWQTPGSTSVNAKANSLLKSRSSLWIGWMWNREPPRVSLPSVALVMDGQDTPPGKQDPPRFRHGTPGAGTRLLILGFRVRYPTEIQWTYCSRAGVKGGNGFFGGLQEPLAARSINLKWSQAGKKDFLHKALNGSGRIPKEMFDRAWLGILGMRWCKCESAWPQRGLTNVP